MTDTREGLEERRATATTAAPAPREARRSDPQRAAVVLGTAVACYVAGCVWFFFVRDRSLWLWAPVLAWLVLAAFAVNWAARRFVDRDRSAWMTWAVRGLILALVASGAGLLYLFVRWDLSGGFAFLGVAFLFLGLGVAVSWLRWTGARWTASLGVAILVACGGLVTVGTVRLSSGGGVGDALACIAAGVLLTPVGLALVSGYVIRDPGDQPTRDVDRLRAARGIGSWVAGAVGLVVVVTVLAVVASHVPDRLVVIGGGALFVLVLAITARSNADIVVLVAAVAIVLTLEPTGAVPPEHATVEDGEDVVVAMGDSFMSGEGAPSYFAGTNTKDVNECRRAPTAYPVRLVGPELAGAPAEDVLFVACSGAKADHLHTRVQHAGEPVDNTVGGLDQLAHAAAVGDQADVDVRMVLVSIGGNDALFGSVVKACALPGDCSELRESMLGQIDHVRSEVSEAYERIDEAYPGVPVVVVPYPVPLSESNVGCDYSPFGEDEHEFIHDFARELNAMLREAAAAPGIDFHYVSTMPAALRDHRLCDGPPGRVGVNLIAANGVGGLFQQRINPTNWFHNSAHPNQRGHAIMGRTLAAWLADQQPLAPRATPVAGDGDENTAADSGAADTCEGRTGRDLASCAETWAWAEASRLLRSWGPWLVALTAGMWLVAVFLVRRLTRLVGRPLNDWSRRRWLALTARRVSPGRQAGGT